MSDGKNEARTLRILEILADYRALQSHINGFITRADAQPSTEAEGRLPGYTLMRQVASEAEPVLSTYYEEEAKLPTSDTEQQKIQLRRLVLDVSVRRFQVYKLYLRAAAGMRWIVHRRLVLGQTLNPNIQNTAFAFIETRLWQDLQGITDAVVMSELRAADQRKDYWLDEDPDLALVLAWIRRQR